MPMSTTRGRAIAALGLLSGVQASAQPVAFTDPSPSDDRWNYPFNTAPGVRSSAPSFGAILLVGFDDRDAQFALAFDTSDDVTAGLGAGSYRVLSARVRATIENEEQFFYDPSYDSYRTHLPVGDVDAEPDTDTGRPVELFATGFFGGGLTAANWVETSPYGAAPVVPPAQGARFMGAATLDASGLPSVDISNQLKDRLEVTPLAVGTTSAVQPGELVPSLTEFTFELDLCSPGHSAYLAQALSDGRVHLSISSLQAASGDPGGGLGDPVYPIWFTKENPLAAALGLSAKLEIEVQVGSVANYDGMGGLDIFDVLAFLADFDAGEPRADLDQNCEFNIFDVLAYLAEFDAGNG